MVKNYHVDGVQGDDRLPAMAAEGGYDEFTLGLYAKQHNGVAAPHDFEDTAWTQWRADQLSLFGKSLYRAVKKNKTGMYCFLGAEYLSLEQTTLFTRLAQMVTRRVCRLYHSAIVPL